MSWGFERRKCDICGGVAAQGSPRCNLCARKMEDAKGSLSAVEEIAKVACVGDVAGERRALVKALRIIREILNRPIKNPLGPSVEPWTIIEAADMAAKVALIMVGEDPDKDTGELKCAKK